MKKYKLVLFGVKETTKIIAQYLHDNYLQVDLIISIDPSILTKTDIANYCDLQETARVIGADYYCVTDYSLKSLEDNFFQENEFDLGIVYGWQRLIPDSIIGRFHTGIFGFHASPELLPKGRGRSPLNWGIILGKTRLFNHLFRYARDADSGDIYSIREFAINPQDTILTLLYKSLIVSRQEIIKLIRDVDTGTLKLTSQSGESYFFPKRTPEDGLIDFRARTTKEIVDLIRGVTKPFPGAFCFNQQGDKITIWEAWPFDQLIDFSAYQSGEVIDNLYNRPIIKTIDGSLIVIDYDGGLLLKKERLGVSQS